VCGNVISEKGRKSRGNGLTYSRSAPERRQEEQRGREDCGEPFGYPGNAVGREDSCDQSQRVQLVCDSSRCSSPVLL
jgi:hypothetical protein